MFTSNSRINTRVNGRGDIRTDTVNQPSGLVVDIDSKRFGKEGTNVTLGFEGAENRFLKLDGFQARTLYESLQKHFDQFVYNA